MIYYFLYFYLALKPFYIFSSGNLQVADIFLICSFIVLCLSMAKNHNSCTSINKKIKGFALFVICVNIISLIYSAIYLRLDFLTSALFYIFNLIGIYVFYYCIQSKKFIINMHKILTIDVIIQFILWITRIGRWYFESRYMGTFNDPNQFAFFIFSSMICNFIIENKFNMKKSKIYYLFSAILIYESSSTGMLLGLTIFLIGESIVYIKKTNIRKYLKHIIIILYVLLVILTILYMANINLINDIYEYAKDSTVMIRIKDKISRADNEEGNLLQERGYDKIFKYPYEIIWGAGHGYNTRFDTFHKGEMHTTFPSILFYYGIIPFIIIIKWVWKNIRYTSPEIKIAYFAVFVESLTLLNERQMLFWIMMIV